MEFAAEVLREVSVDPYFKVRFEYESEGICIKRGVAEIIRTAPRPQIKYDADTCEKLMAIDKTKLELELLNTVFCYILSYGVVKSWRGNIILNTA